MRTFLYIYRTTTYSFAKLKRALPLSFLILLFLTSCSKKEEIPQPGSPDAKALRVAIVTMDVCKPFTDAYEKGLLDSLHADIALKTYNAFSECRHAILDDKVDCAVMDSSLLLTINSQLPEEKKLRAMPILFNPAKSKSKDKTVFHFLTSKRARIQLISQMSDKIIAADSHGTTHDIATAAIDSLLRHKQLVFVVQCEDMKTRMDMLNTGNVDAAVLPEPYASKALKAGATEIPLTDIKQAPMVLAISPKVKSEHLIKLRKNVKIF